MCFGGGNKGPSQAEIIAQQEAAAKAERERLMTEQAEKEADAQSKSQSKIAEMESKRKAFASGALESKEEEDAARRKFLKGV